MKKGLKVQQKTIVQEAFAETVSAAIKLMRALGLLTEMRGDLIGSPGLQARFADDVSVSVRKSSSDGTDRDADADLCRIYVYIFGCSGCAKLGRRLKTKIYKIGTTIESDLQTRLQQIGKEQYGACTGEKSTIETEEGFSAWVAVAIETSRQSDDASIAVLQRAIKVDLPRTMTRRAFDAALQKVLAPRALHRLKNAGPKRLTQYGMGGTSRLSAARELYEFSPNSKADGDLLLGLIESILDEHRKDRK